MSLPEVQVSLKADELQVIRLMREENAESVDFSIFRREGRIVKVERTTVHVKEFRNDKLREVLPGNGKAVGG